MYCNGVMFFHKSVDATSHTQNAQYIFGVTIILCHSLLLTPHVVLMAMSIFFKEIKKVILELGKEHIVQIITDNGSNYKKGMQVDESEVLDCVATVPCSYH
jgi:hypothetical protein